MEKLTKIANLNLKKSMENIGAVRFVPYSTSKIAKGVPSLISTAFGITVPAGIYYILFIIFNSGY
jgi:hypothetical protein